MKDSNDGLSVERVLMMLTMNRVYLIVLDGLGVGGAPDAALYGDSGANTLRSLLNSERLSIPTLTNLGLIECLNPESSTFSMNLDQRAAHGVLQEVSTGKDTTVGHWEIAGLITMKPLPVFPQGFPDTIMNRLVSMTGVEYLCNKSYSGTKVIMDYGEEHLQTGKPIIYTSADSVCQIAAHEDVVELGRLYEYCKIAREVFSGENAVSRIIARPFSGAPGKFYRTVNRRDFSLIPPQKTLLDYLTANSLAVISVGKVNDIFAGRGITEPRKAVDNATVMSVLTEIQKEQLFGLCFANLCDFDSKYGHRNDIDGYADELSRFDSWLSGFIEQLNPDDLLIITADHGCDPGYPGTDHTRERVPLLVVCPTWIQHRCLGVMVGFNNVASLVLKAFF